MFNFESRAPSLQGYCQRFDFKYISYNFLSPIRNHYKCQNLYLNALETLKVISKKKRLNQLKGGCTRFEVEHISCNLLLYIGKI